MFCTLDNKAINPQPHVSFARELKRHLHFYSRLVQKKHQFYSHYQQQ